MALNEKISIVIISKNEEANIESCIESVINSFESLSNVNYEIILVDSNSEDNTIVKALKYGEKYPLKIIEITHSNLFSAALGRKVGSEQAVGEYILFLDGDMILENDFLSEGMEILENNSEDKVGLIGLRRDVISLPNGKIQIQDNIYKTHKVRTAEHFGGALLIKASVLKEVGNYYSHLISSEEPELYLRLKKNGYYILEAPIKMITHKIIKPSKQSIYKRVFSKRTLGIGQTFRSAIDNNSFLQLLTHNALNKFLVPFILDIATLVFLIVCISLNYNLLISLMGIFVIQLLGISYSLITKNIKSNLYIKIIFVNTIVGFFYKPKLNVELKKIK
ncbi:hypothetical protein AS034_16260 [[Bacillus] enclensis]|uniref:Glycosyl transferase family 2 n=1 Tax=[Bacillus] enclensis TaxID=1402860 RepID=A0A0V8HCY5_9BACI|nr:glycosyltransferase [[Bacillus] enclensis]KSU60394.1 hypothetical protein AS034_16260 [[Bacillus] enclensis]SCC24016.1 Glycosyl transferase family 2 [[Bacillus] enclensis]